MLMLDFLVSKYAPYIVDNVKYLDGFFYPLILQSMCKLNSQRPCVLVLYIGIQERAKKKRKFFLEAK